MIADLKPYAEYKESGLPWLGRVPAHWDVSPVGRYFRVKSGDMIAPKDERDDGVPIYGGNGVRGYTYQINTPGPILLLGRVGAKCGCVHLVSGDIWASEHALRVIFKTESNLRFFAYLLNHADLNRLAIRTAQPLINSTIVRSYRATIPPPSEQAAIVRFLDWANGRLERAIRAKRKVIALLNEQKQAIIHRAVTRGLDPSVPLKPSGIPWLGEIPQHWEVRRLKWVLRLQRGFDLPADLRRVGSVPVYSSGGHIDNHDVASASAPGIVIGRYGSTDAVFFVTEPYWPHNTALFTTTLYDNHARWCFYLLRSFSKGAHAGKSAVPGVDRKDLFDIVVPRPPIAEQSELAAAIDKQLAKFDRAVAKITSEVDLLREYRTRLVADVVTGKLDVREAAARLPDEAPLDTVEDDAGLIDEAEAADEEAEA